MKKRFLVAVIQAVHEMQAHCGSMGRSSVPNRWPCEVGGSDGIHDGAQYCRRHLLFIISSGSSSAAAGIVAEGDEVHSAPFSSAARRSVHLQATVTLHPLFAQDRYSGCRGLDINEEVSCRGRPRQQPRTSAGAVWG